MRIEVLGRLKALLAAGEAAQWKALRAVLFSQG
jgi:hypothetical protein